MLATSCSPDYQDFDANFIGLTTQLSEFLRQEDIHKMAFRPGLKHFKALSKAQKESTIKNLEFYNSLCTDHQFERESLRDSKKFTWRALMKFGFTPPSDMLHKITDEDVVEIYSEDHTQLFRNFEFFSLSSYTLEELFCLEWWALFQRDDEHSLKILAMANQIFAGAAPEGFSHAIPEHVTVEAQSQDKFRVSYCMKHFIPLYRNKRVEAVASVARGRKLI